MQTLIVIGLLALSAAYVGYLFLRRLGFWGGGAGCGCGCESACAGFKVSPVASGRKGVLGSMPCGARESSCCGCAAGKPHGETAAPGGAGSFGVGELRE